MPAGSPQDLLPEPGHGGLRPPSRRLVLGAGLGLAGIGAAGLLGGCRLRLEDDAPAVPFLPRKSIPDEALLVQAHGEVRALAAMAAAVGSQQARALAVAHERQAQVLGSILTTGGVPGSVIDARPTSGPATTSATGSAAGSGSATPAPVTAAALAAAEAQAATPAALTALGQAVAQRTLLAAISAYRATAAAMLSAAPAWPPAAALPAEAAKAALEPTRQAVYATQVAAARTPFAQRAPYLDLLGTLQGREAALAQSGGADVGEAPAGYRLPFAVTTPEHARKLVRHVLDVLVARGLDPLGPLPVGSAAVADVVRLQAQAAALPLAWGGTLPPFPGLVDG